MLQPYAGLLKHLCTLWLYCNAHFLSKTYTFWQTIIEKVVSVLDEIYNKQVHTSHRSNCLWAVSLFVAEKARLGLRSHQHIRLILVCNVNLRRENKNKNLITHIIQWRYYNGIYYSISVLCTVCSRLRKTVRQISEDRLDS